MEKLKVLFKMVYITRTYNVKFYAFVVTHLNILEDGQIYRFVHVSNPIIVTTCHVNYI